MTLAIEKIKAAALAATQGEWRTTDRGDAGRLDVVALLESEVFKDRLTLARGVGKQNATYIAAANPSAVLELITRLEAAEKEVSRLEWIISLHPAIDSSVIGQKSVLAEWLDIKLGEPVAWACVTEEGDCEQIDYGTESPLPGDAGFFPLFKKPELK